MAPESKQPSKPRKSSPPKTGARRGRPRKNRDDDDMPKRPENMPLPRSLLDTTIADGEEYRPGSGAPSRQAEPAPARSRSRNPPPPRSARTRQRILAPSGFPGFRRQRGGAGHGIAPLRRSPLAGQRAGTAPVQLVKRPHRPPHYGQGGRDRRFDRNRDRRHGGQPFQNPNRPPRVPLTPEEEAARAAQQAAARAAAEAAAAERAKLARVLKLN